MSTFRSSAGHFTVRILLRISIAAVWIYQGFWHKVLDVTGRHRTIMEQALGTSFGGPALKMLGAFEVLLGMLVLLGWRLHLTAAVQTILLCGMNAAGLMFASAHIPDPGGMLTMNFAFIMAIWAHVILFCFRPKPTPA